MRVFVMGLCVALVATPARAEPQSPGRGFLAGMSGPTFGANVPGSATVAVQAGVRLKGGLSAIGEAGLMRNILRPELQRELDIIGRLSGLTGSGDLTLDGRLSAWYGSGGVRWMWTEGRLRPYVEGGTGAARLRLHVRASTGDATAGRDIENELARDNPALETTRPIALAGGGIAMPISHRWSVDAAYRFMRIFTEERAINANAIHGAVAFGF